MKENNFLLQRWNQVDFNHDIMKFVVVTEERDTEDSFVEISSNSVSLSGVGLTPMGTFGYDGLCTLNRYQYENELYMADAREEWKKLISEGWERIEP